MEKRFLSEREAAAFIGISHLTLYKIRHEPGKRLPIPFSRVGVRIVYDREQLVAWIHAHQATPAPDAAASAGDADAH